MAQVIATGNMADASGTASVWLAQYDTKSVGLMLQGTFGSATIAMILGLGSMVHTARVIYPVNGVATALLYTEIGLYHIPMIFDELKFSWSGGTNGVTDIDYTLFQGDYPRNHSLRCA